MDDLASWILLLGLIFLFWGEPDNWDKFNAMVDNQVVVERVLEKEENRIDE